MTDPKPEDMPTHPVPANDPDVSGPSPLVLQAHEAYGPMGLLALDAYVAENVLGYDRRKVQGIYRWREPRDVAAGAEPTAWQNEPPRLSIEEYGIAPVVLRRAGERLKWLWRVGLRPVQAPGFNGVACCAELGPHRVIATTPELGCVIVMAMVGWAQYEALRTELTLAAHASPTVNEGG